MKNPCHPGEIIREDVLAVLGLNVTEAAKVLGVPRQALSAEMAPRVEKAFGHKTLALSNGSHYMRERRT
jgi:plasmid maintenance system antidote protein VapI